MLKYCIYLFIFTLIIFSCGTNEDDIDEKSSFNKVKTDESEDENLSTTNQTEDNRIESTDNKVLEKFVLGEYEFVIFKDIIPNHIYFEDTEGVYTRTKEVQLIETYEGVERIEDTLRFFVGDNYSMLLYDLNFDSEKENFKDVMDFYFQGHLNKLRYWNIFFQGHVYGGTLLMHMDTGEKLYTLNDYVYASDTSFILFYDYDLDAKFAENGFHLLVKDGNKLIDKGIKEFDMWGPKSIVYDEITERYYIQRIFIDGYTTEMDTVSMEIRHYESETDS
jgi:hypothetical protein